MKVKTGLIALMVVAALALVVAVVLHPSDEAGSRPGQVSVASPGGAAPPDLSAILADGGGEAPVTSPADLNGQLEPTLLGGKVQSYRVSLARDDPAGLKDGDVILSVGNQPLSDFATAETVRDLIKIGDDVVLRRDGREMRFAYGYPAG